MWIKVCPCDGTVITLGKVTDGNQIEQVKGIRYSIKDLMGQDPRPSKDEQLIDF